MSAGFPQRSEANGVLHQCEAFLSGTKEKLSAMRSQHKLGLNRCSAWSQVSDAMLVLGNVKVPVALKFPKGICLEGKSGCVAAAEPQPLHPIGGTDTQ